MSRTEDEELLALERVALTIMVTVATVTIVGVAVAWHAVSYAAQAVQAVRHKP